jgi:hypothetical protein
LWELLFFHMIFNSPAIPVKDGGKFIYFHYGSEGILSPL